MKHPRTTSVVAALKRIGVTALRNERNNWRAVKGAAYIDWIDQDGDALCLRVARCNDHDDCQSDYSAGSFFNTIKSALAYLQKWSGQEDTSQLEMAR